jgi:hypothetical protein
MTAVLALNFGSKNYAPVALTVTIGTISAGNVGYAESAAGSISSAAFRGTTITAVRSTATSVVVNLAGIHPQNFFRQLTIEDAGTTDRTFLTSAVSSFSNSSFSSWTWTYSALWTAADGGETKDVVLE